MDIGVFGVGGSADSAHTVAAACQLTSDGLSIESPCPREGDDWRQWRRERANRTLDRLSRRGAAHALGKFLIEGGDANEMARCEGRGHATRYAIVKLPD